MFLLLVLLLPQRRPLPNPPLRFLPTDPLPPPLVDFQERRREGADLEREEVVQRFGVRGGQEREGWWRGRGGERSGDDAGCKKEREEG